ncbi:hypothetical protein [Sinorhizobium mexicanum]|nr:hypothetical protein [Sinorhizobium mexicanum]MBP1882422.1 hypothetical protein [Sinorhizobium mexicanum]
MPATDEGSRSTATAPAASQVFIADRRAVAKKKRNQTDASLKHTLPPIVI